MYGWISALAVSAIGSLVAMGIVRGWSVFWRWPIGRPDIRGDWSIVAAKIAIEAGGTDDAHRYEEHVRINRQLGPYVRGTTTSPTSDTGRLAEGAADLRLRGRFYGEQTLAYTHFQVHRSKQPKEVGAGLVIVEASLAEAGGFATNVGVDSSEPSVYQITMHRSAGSFDK